MPTTLRSGLSTLFRHLPPPDAPADADLLTRFVHTHDEPAFAEVVRRHGAMVLSVCRRRLGNGPDADDAYQVTFLALARDARKIGSRESLAGWLYRVAHLTALKMSGRVHRHRPEPLTTDPAAPMNREPDADLKAVIDEELSALPDRFRGVAVLCLIEGLTNTEAAERLGIPKGTVDSRLSTAKEKLRVRLLRRGIAASALVSLETVLSSATVSASMRAAALATDLIPLALNYASGTPLPGSEHLTTIANGVKPTMNALSIKWLAALALTTGLLGGAGVGIYQATAGDDKPPAEKKAEQKKPPKAEGKLEATPAVQAKDEKGVRSALAKPVAGVPDALTLKDLFELIYKEYGVIVRIDAEAVKRLGVKPGPGGAAQAEPLVRAVLAVTLLAGGEPGEIERYYSQQISLPLTRGMTVADLLAEALAQLPGRWAYRVKDDIVLVGPAFVPPVLPGSGANSEERVLGLNPTDILEQVVGAPVSLAVEDKPLTDVIALLRKQTGANVVIDSRCKDKAKQLVSATFDDVRLLSALDLLADMCDLKAVNKGNVYYVTSPDNAAKIQTEMNRDLFGEPTPKVPSGFVTDGYKLYPKTADMKPVEDTSNGVGGPSTIPPFRAKPVPAPEKK